MTVPAASVIVRCKDEATTIERVLHALGRQTIAVEIIVIDSGSTDGTLDIARRHADRLIEIRPEEFSFGGALNLGAAEAEAAVHVALSAHCEPAREDWIERALTWYRDPAIAATNGDVRGPDGRPLEAPIIQDRALAWAHPEWGFSNHAASWRAEVWREHRFDETMTASEDKEWARRVLAAGWLIAYDPLLWVSSRHRRTAGPRALFDRSRREAFEMASHADVPLLTTREALRRWWSDLPAGSRRPPWFHRLNYLRTAEIAGRWTGHRRVRRGWARR